MPLLAYWRRHLAVAAAIILTVAVGIGAATAVYSVVEAVILRALPVRHPERLVWMWNARVERDRAPFSALDLVDYREQNTVLDGLAPFINWTANLTGIGDAERLEGMRADPSFFDVVEAQAALGRTFAPSDARAQVAVLTDRLWRRRFGADPAVVGQVVSLNGAGYTIVGVMPRGFVFPFRDVEIVIPLVIDGDPRRADRGAGFLRVVARLKPGESVSSAKANLDAIGARLRHDYPDANAKKLGVNLYPLDREIVGDARALLLTLLAAVCLLLLVVCANIANLLLVGMASRRRELSLRAALGATRTQIGAQLLSEIAALVLTAGVGGLLIGRALARVLVWWGGTALPRLEDIGLTPGVTAFAGVATAGAALVCGLMPACLLSDAPAIALADEGRANAGSLAQGRMRRAFVTVQVAAALMLLVAMTMSVRSFTRLQAVDAGFDGRHVLSLQLALPPSTYARPAEIATLADRLHADFTQLPGVDAAAAISLLPLSGLLSTQDYRVVGQAEPPPDEIPQAHYRIVTPDYFRTMGIRLRGREFNDDDRETTRPVAVISRTFAERHWPGASPLGEHILVGRDRLEIVGVCDDVKQFGLDGGRTADLYIPLRQMPLNQAQFMAARMYWVLHTAADPMAVADGARAIVRRLDKDVATSSTRPILQILAASIGSRKFNTDLIRLAGLASLGLALLGVYAVTAFSVTRRTREIGIRITLGATPGQVLRPLLAEEWTALVTGLVLGAVGAVFVARALAPVLFAASGPEPRLIGGAVLVLGGVGALASYVPARRAARSDPAAALRIDQ